MNNQSAHCEIGAFVGNSDGRTPGAPEVRDFEQLINRHLRSILFFWGWGDGDFPAAALKEVRDHDGYDTGIIPHITWEPWQRRGADDDSFSLLSIIEGRHDAYIARFARDCRAWKNTIRLRFAHEMIHFNNPEIPGWYPWQDRPQEYVAAWRRVRGIFKNENALNVEFIWAPLMYPAWFDALKNYYPGPDHVEWLGIDGYNWGGGVRQKWPYEQNVMDLFYPLYHVFVDHPEIFGNKKIMIAEIGTGEDPRSPNNKPEWIRQMFGWLKNEFPRVEAFYWFNVKKEKDWRVNSSPESLAAFKSGVADPYFISHP